MASIWDSVVAGASKAATQAGEATQVAATKAKLHADLLVIDRDIHARKEKFGVEMYSHLEKITSTQEFYVADDRLINVIRPTLIKAQREVAAYERKRDAMKGKVNTAEANRSGTASIFTAQTISEKIMNAAKYAAAGAKEAASKTELAMLERQILGFKEAFGVELYPIFESMEDNEGWLPTDRKVRSLYDSAREDIAAMMKLKDEKREQIKELDGVEGSGLTPAQLPPSVNQNVTTTTPTVVATPVESSWTSTAPAAVQPQPAQPTVAANGGYGSTQPPQQMPAASYCMDQNKQSSGDSGFGFMQTTQTHKPSNDSGFGFMQSTQAQQPSVPQQQPAATQQQHQQPPQQSLGAAFDPFDGLSGSSSNNTAMNHDPFDDNPAPPPAATVSNTNFDQFSLSGNNNNESGGALSDADMNLFKY